MVNFVDIVKQGFISKVKGYEPSSEWKVVIMDSLAKKVFDNVGDDDDLLKENVTSIEDLNSTRPTQSSMPCIYFISSSITNLELIIRDSNCNKYKFGYLYLINQLSSEQSEHLNNSSHLKKYLKKIETIHVDYYPIESKVFGLGLDKNCLSDLYSGSLKDSRKIVDNIAKKLVSVCSSLDENPVIRYQAMENGLHNPQSLALSFQGELDEFLNNHSDFPKKDVINRGRAVMIVLDRSVDLYAPILHELTYQAMVQDLLGLEEGNVYRCKFMSGLGVEMEQVAVLDENDSLWVHLRHMHIADCIQELTRMFRLSIKDNPAAMNRMQRELGTHQTSIQDLQSVIESVPELQELSQKFSLHFDLAGRCMDLIKSNQLDSVIDVEQKLVTKKDSDGENVKNILNEMAPILSNHHIGIEDKLRLILLLSMAQPSDFDKRKLEAVVGLNEEQKKSITNLSYLSINKPMTFVKSTPKSMNPFRRTIKPQDEQINPYALSRYIPQLKRILQAHINKTMSNEEFPYIQPPPAHALKNPVQSLRVNRPTWHKGPLHHHLTTKKKAGGPIIIFVAGGLTYSEIRSCYEIADSLNREILIGTTHLIKPTSFIKELMELNIGKANNNQHAIVKDNGNGRPLPKISDQPKPNYNHSTSNNSNSNSNNNQFQLPKFLKFGQ